MQESPVPEQLVVVGLGNVGLPTALLLAVAGFDLVLVDGDTMEEKNLSRQLYRPCHVGRPKAECAAEVLQGFRPSLRCDSVVDDCRNLGPGFWRGHRAVFGCIDSLVVEAWLGSMTQLVGAALIRPATTGAAGGAGSATVRYYPAEGGACPQCWWDETAYAVAARRVSCGSNREVNPSAGIDQTAEDGFIAAGLAVRAFAGRSNSSWRLQLAGVGEAARLGVTPLEPKADCPGRHGAPPSVPVEPGPELTLGNLFQLAAGHLGSRVGEVSLDTSLQPLVPLAGCCRCGLTAEPAFLRFPRGSRTCGRCGRELDLAKESPVVTESDLGDLGALPIERLRPPKGWGGVFRAKSAEILVYLLAGEQAAAKE